MVLIAMQAKCQKIHRQVTEATFNASIGANDHEAPRLPDLRKQTNKWAALQNVQLQQHPGSYTQLSFDFWLASKKKFCVINGR